MDATRRAARHAAPSTSSPRPPKVTRRRASSYCHVWHRSASRTRCWTKRMGSWTRCKDSVYPGPGVATQGLQHVEGTADWAIYRGLGSGLQTACTRT